MKFTENIYVVIVCLSVLKEKVRKVTIIFTINRKIVKFFQSSKNRTMKSYKSFQNGFNAIILVENDDLKRFK